VTLSRYTGPFVSTWLQDHVDTTYARLVDVFGEPDAGDGEKVDAEWVLETPAGVCTIYNYKDGYAYNGAAGTPVERITDWHIGGTTPDVVQYVREALA
jgi:hypothetical protein